MKRRDMVKLVPLSLAGITGIMKSVLSDDLRYDYPGVDNYRKSQNENLPAAGQAEPLAIRYTKKVRDMLIWIRETQSENLLEASYVIAQATMRKKTCWYSWNMGHSTTFDLTAGRNGVPEIFTVGYDPKKSQDGDVFLDNIRVAPEVLSDIEKKDIVLIGSPIPWGSDARNAHYIELDSAKQHLRPYADIWIETNIDTVGAVMQVQGMPAPIGPVSGVIGMATFWMIVADACRIMAREGKSVPVRGDEPVISGANVPRVSLYDPLMDDYFENLLLQIEMIGAELGDIKRIAGMAVDSVLAGGRVWCYSRDRSALAVEAQTRRGGLAMTRGVYYNEKDGTVVSYDGKPIKGTSNDLVIMGIFKPDDEVDQKCLDRFRSMNMKVASLGPMTRDNRIPGGRTVPKEADVHVGRMCDTYGL